MKELLDKLSTYNIFNYLLPGILYVIFARVFTGYNLIQENLILGPFLYYFIGMTISNVGALIIEPLLKAIKFLKFSEYSDYVKAIEQDAKIQLLSEINNTFRNITSMIILLLFTWFYNYLQTALLISDHINMYIIILLLFVIYLFAYRKQTNYIMKRISIYKTPE